MKKLLPIFAVCATIALVLLTGCPNVSGGGSSGGGGQEEKIYISGTMSLDVSDDLLEVADITVAPFVPKSPDGPRAAGGADGGRETLASTHWQKSFYGVSKNVGFVYNVTLKSGIVLEERTYEFVIVKNVQATTTKGAMTIESKSFTPEKIVLTGNKSFVAPFISELNNNNNCFIVPDSDGKMSESAFENFNPKIVESGDPVLATDDEISRRATKKVHAIGSISGSAPSFAKSFSDRIVTSNSDIDTADFIAIAKGQTIDATQAKSILKAGLLGKHIVLVEPTAANIADFWKKMDAALTTDFIKEVVKDPSIENVVGNPFYASVKRMKGKTSSVFKDCLAYKVHKNGVHTVLPETGLNARDYGRFAESIIDSIEEDDELYPHLPLGPANDASLPDVMNAQKEEYTFKVKADSKYNSETVKVQFFIWQVYSFDEQADYYLVQETVTMQNSQLKCGPDDKYKWWTSIPNGDDFAYGPYMKDVYMQNTLSSASSIYSVAPNTTSSSSSYSEGFSWNIGGNVGFNMSGPTGGISGGVSYSNSTSRTVSDLSAKYTESTTAPRWDYYGGNEPNHDWELDGLTIRYIHGSAPQTLKSDVILNNNWVWKVSNPSGSYSFNAEVYVLTHYLTDSIDRGTLWDDHNFRYKNCIDPTTNDTTINMSTPSRTMDNYLMSYEVPSDWDEAKIGRFRDFLTQYFKLWQPNIDIYSVDEAGNQEATKDHFTEVVEDFKNNKQTFKDNQFTGRFTFKIKNKTAPDTDYLMTETIDIN